MVERNKASIINCVLRGCFLVNLSFDDDGLAKQQQLQQSVLYYNSRIDRIRLHTILKMEFPVRLVSPSADGFAENIFLVGIDIPMAALG